jgi:hypothetical protein
MKIDKKILCVIFLWMSVSMVLGAERKVSDEGIVDVRVEEGRAIEVIVEDGVADLIRSGDPATIKVEHTSGHVFVTPLTQRPAELTIIDTSGRSFRLHFVFGSGMEERLVLAAAIEHETPSGNGRSVSALIRDLVQGRLPAGAVVRNDTTVMFDNGQVRLQLVRVYEMPSVRAMVMKAENMLERSLVVPVQEIAFPRMLAISSQRDILSARGKDGASTMVYMVAGK